MSLPRVRFTAQQLMLAVAAIALAFYFYTSIRFLETSIFLFKRRSPLAGGGTRTASHRGLRCRGAASDCGKRRCSRCPGDALASGDGLNLGGGRRPLRLHLPGNPTHPRAAIEVQA